MWAPVLPVVDVSVGNDCGGLSGPGRWCLTAAGILGSQGNHRELPLPGKAAPGLEQCLSWMLRIPELALEL